jgi:hypothetical protein
VVASRCSGEETRCRQTHNADEDDRGRRVPPTGPPAKKGNWLVSTENFGSTSPTQGGSQNLQKTSARRPTTTYISTEAMYLTSLSVQTKDSK